MPGMKKASMTTLLVCLAALLAVSTAVGAAQSAGPAVGDAAPNFTLQDSEDKAFELKSAMKKGRVVLAFFPKPFSASSIRQWEALRDVAKTFQRAGVMLVGISSDSRSTLKRFRAAHRLPYRMLSDGSGRVSEQYGALFGFEKRRVTAQKVVVVDRRGVVIYRDERYESKKDSDLRALLRAVGGD